METAGASSPAVTKIPGEPAILITGLPNPAPKNRESKSKSESKPESESRSKPDPCFGEWLEGRKVRKKFGDLHYNGKVVSYDKDENWYRVEYEDGDFEDLDWYELETVLVPLEISIPLKNLALNLGKWDDNYNNSASKSGLKRGRMRRENSATGLESGINDLALVPVKMEITEEKEESLLVSKNSKRGRKPKGNNGSKNEGQLVIFKDEEKSGEASRRKREGKRRESMNTTAKAERQKRKEQQSQR
ncbi:hypothetical protein LUZ60_011106 [Juncus effusus]|nr:hypothetical protein LUZ60_011106 [Juncus effusus]